VHQETQLQTCHLREFWEPLRYNLPDCPVCQRSNGYTAPTVVCNGTVKVNSARMRAQKSSSARRRIGQWIVTVRCTTGLSGGPVVRSSNSRNPTAWWRGWRTGQCPVAHRTVRCAIRQKPPPTVNLVVGARNTPQPPHFNASMFSAFKPHTRALDFIQRHKQEIKSSPKSKDHSNQIVTSERDKLCSFEFLRLDLFSSSFVLVSNSIVIKARDTNCVVVLVGTLCPDWLRREAHSV
jgi:hypothetical protein